MKREAIYVECMEKEEDAKEQEGRVKEEESGPSKRSSVFCFQDMLMTHPTVWLL